MEAELGLMGRRRGQVGADYEDVYKICLTMFLSLIVSTLEDRGRSPLLFWDLEYLLTRVIGSTGM